MQRWTISDGAGEHAFTFEVNPNSGGTFEIDNNVSSTNTTSGVAVVNYGVLNPSTMKFSGIVLTQQGYDNMNNWFSKVTNQVKLTDDIGNESWVFLTNLEWVWAPTHSYRWRHTFTADLVEMNVTEAFDIWVSGSQEIVITDA